MKFRVMMQPRAEADASEIYHRIHRESPLNADRWFERLCQVIASLEDLPRRCPKAPESRLFKREIRQRLFGAYRILFVIEDNDVQIIHIRHSARRYLEPGDE